ncbi:hypothetical protein [Halorientalis pallida]|uniref:Uncharacterized protein n=1 Tax=Halorientalis pallida TaxID=2479928 RepID=A0A498KZ25_9EURY|nr:hypothetical protein [Halorientalis pallida]RXK47800.1 hypothetical protein EAF64_14200 [Halorientalis pallida]
MKYVGPLVDNLSKQLTSQYSGGAQVGATHSRGPTPANLPDGLNYEERVGIGIWKFDSLAEALESGALAEGEAHFREHAGEPEMDACVVQIGDAETGGSEALEHVAEESTELGEATGISRIAYVTDGLARMAIAQKNDAADHTANGFTDLEDGLEWAIEA